MRWGRDLCRTHRIHRKLAGDACAGLLANTIGHQFDKRLEALKADIRDNEKESDEIRSFLISTRRERDSAVQEKRVNTAEELLRARHDLAKLTILVEDIKILNSKSIIRANDTRISEFICGLTEPVEVAKKLKKCSESDMTLPRL